MATTFHNPPMQQPNTAISIARFGISVIFLGTAIFCVVGYLTSESGTHNHLIAAVISLYLFAECWYYLSRTDAFGLLAPVLLASIVHFFLAYLLTTAATVVDPEIQSRFAGYFSAFQDDMSAALIMVGVSAFCMWRGHYLGAGLGRKLGWRMQSWSGLRHELVPRLPAVFSIQALYILVVVYAIAVGIFGFSSTPEARAANIALLDVISTVFAAGALSFLLIMCHLFRKHDSGEPASLLLAICVGLTILQVVIGAISGFKSQVVMPFVIIVMAQFLVRHRISLAYLSGGIFALFIAYQVIEPYRIYIMENDLRGQSDAGSMVENLQKSYEQRDIHYRSDQTVISQIVQRFDLAAMTALGLATFDKNVDAALKGREMAETLYLAPILAFTPRALWQDKPTYQTGVWFNRYLGFWESDTSVAMGPSLGCI